MDLSPVKCLHLTHFWDPPHPPPPQTLNLDLSASTKHSFFSLLYSQGKLPRAGTLHRAKARYMLPPRPSCLRSSSPSPVTPSLSAGFCLCWLGLPPTSPGRGDRGQTHRANSHCRSTGRARAPPAEAAARLPHHPPPSPHPWAMGWGSLGATAGCSSQSRTGSVRSGAHTLFPY